MIYMAVFIGKIKTEIYRNGNGLNLAKVKSKLCLATLLTRYIRLPQIYKHTNGYIFAFAFAHATARENVLYDVNKIDLNGKKFT